MKGIFRALLVLPPLLVAPSAVQAQYTCSTNAGDTNTITITGYSGAGGGVGIPARINGLLVTGIAEFCFAGTSLTNVTIPGSVTNIGDSAFSFSSRLAGVYFEGNVPAAGSNVFTFDNNATVYYLPGATGWSTNFAGRPALLWNPLIQTGTGNFGPGNNQFGFNITGTTNIPIVVEACTNLAGPVWSRLTNVLLTNGSFYFSDAQSENYPARYYRISSP